MSQPRILVVEDDPDTARLLENWLRAHQYQHIGTATTGQQALDLAIATHPDLVIMDIVLPGELDGIQTAHILLERLDIPILYLTAYTDEALYQRARETSPAAYLTKPFNDRDLDRAVRVALDRHDLLRRLKTSEAHLSEAQTVARIGSWRWDVQQDQVFASSELLRLLDMPSGTFEPRFNTFLQRVRAEDQPKVLQAIESLLNGEDTDDFEVGVPRQAGEPIVLRVRAAARFNTEGKALELVGTARDVTREWMARQEAEAYRDQLEATVTARTAELEASNQRLQSEIAQHLATEKSLRQSEARIRSILRAAPVGVGVLVDRVIQEVNAALVSMTGYKESELIGQSTRMLYPTQAEFEWVGAAKYQQVLDHGIASIETHWRRKDGRIIDVSMTLSPIGGSDLAQGVTFIAQDITLSKQAEQARLGHEANQRNALVREVHHRIKNNLQGVIGLLRQHMASHPEVRQPIEAAIAQVNTVAVIHGLQGRIPQQELRLRELLQEVSGAVATLSMMPHPPAVADNLSGDVWLDPRTAVAIALILNELIQNALKHGDPADGSKVEIALDGDGQLARIHISNLNGSLPRSLDLSTGQGCGTGLDLVRTLLPRHGAQLNLYERGQRVHAEFILSPPVTCISLHADEAPKNSQN